MADAPGPSASKIAKPTPKPASWHLEQADQMKAAGNEFYTSKNYTKAIRQYHNCLLHVRAAQNALGLGSTNAPMMLAGSNQTPQNNEDVAAHTVTINAMLCKCYNNLAACILHGDNRKRDDYMRAAGYCDRVLELEANNEKALFRKAAALCEAAEQEKALEVLAKCDANNTEVQRYTRRCQQELAEERKQRDAVIKQNFLRAQARERASAQNGHHIFEQHVSEENGLMPSGSGSTST